MKIINIGLGLLLSMSIFYVLQVRDHKAPTTEMEIKTKLESLQTQTDRVVIKGYSEIGKIYGSGYSTIGYVKVTAMEFTDAASGNKQV